MFLKFSLVMGSPILSNLKGQITELIKNLPELLTLLK